MSTSFSTLKFKFPWRSYQATLLKHFDNHISDNHFHVIAPPGSGKTILGLEILRRLNRKTLVLAPTLTIRNQWEERLQSFFTEDKDFNSFSFDIKKPSDVTFATYQSLHAFYKTFEDKEDYFKFFKTHNIEALVLDEAHHLKNAWWNCLYDLKTNDSFFVVALTATPPYDSDRAEVSKYFKLCGEVDDEIAVPDLVKEADLAPHQDFVFLSKPEDLEINFIYKYRQKIVDFNDELITDESFISFIKQHRFFDKTDLCLDEIYSNAEYFSSILIFLNAAGVSIDSYKLEVLGFDEKETIQFPKLTLNWLEILFQNLLVNDREQLIKHETYLLNLEKQLRKISVFEKRKVSFVGEELLYKSLTNSPSKLKSVVSIVASEHESLNDDLRCVVLTDYIRKEFINTKHAELSTINKIGVVPIFQHLRCGFSNSEQLAVLSGSLVIIHQSVLSALNKIESEDNFSIVPLDVDPKFLVVSSKKKTKNSIVNIMTQLFENGDIKVLIGTKSLLGEGWDAPSINSLILASFVGSFVSSNQMRGRAIRKDADKVNKTGNIWHLACVDFTAPNGGKDIEMLRRRFEAFVGISNNKQPYIENGYERLDFPEQVLEQDIEWLNKETLEQAKNRPIIAKNWKKAIVSGSQLKREIKVYHLGKKTFKKQQQIYFFDVVRFFIFELLAAISFFYLEFILNSFQIILQKGLTYFLYSFFAFFTLSFGYKLYKAVTLYIKHGYLYKRIKKMGFAILDSLYDLGYMTSPRNSVTVMSKRVSKGDVVCNLVGGNQFENTLFSTALNQLLEPIKSPRYLIIKTNAFRKRLNIENFYPVPEIFGDKKEKVLVFQKNWSYYLGKNKLVYTRQIEGRKLLLKARLFHAHNAFIKTSKEITVWK